MAALFNLPKAVPLDTNGLLIPGAKLYFFDAGTTTPRTVYSDPDLAGGHAISQPVTADSAGRFQPIWIAPGTYKATLQDADGNAIYTVDNIDTGLAAGTGALAVASGGTGSTTAAGARTNLGAASQADLSSLSASLGDLAYEDTLTRTKLASGFGVIILQRSQIGSTTSLVTCSTALPIDDTIPQIGEGTSVLSGNYTPISASSVLAVGIQISAGFSTGQIGGAALFTGASVNAIAAKAGYPNSAGIANLSFLHEMASPGTNQITFSVRAGMASGTLYVNGNSSGTRIFGGVQKATLTVTETLAF
jgi:hypothetical protein